MRTYVRAGECTVLQLWYCCITQERYGDASKRLCSLVSCNNKAVRYYEYCCVQQQSVSIAAVRVVGFGQHNFQNAKQDDLSMVVLQEVVLLRASDINYLQLSAVRGRDLCTLYLYCFTWIIIGTTAVVVVNCELLCTAVLLLLSAEVPVEQYRITEKKNAARCHLLLLGHVSCVPSSPHCLPDRRTF